MIGENSPLAEPSWPKVIGTTLRLWAQRHVLPARRHPGPGQRHRGRAAVLGLALVLLAAAVVVLGFNRPHDSAALRSADGTSPGSAPGGAALAAASASRQQAAAWVAAQVSHGVIVACDPLMCGALQQHGFPAADLSTIGAASGDPLGSGIVMSTTAVRSQFRGRLENVYAPVVIASFGTGASRVQVRISAVGGAAAYLSALRADLNARKVAGFELDRNKRVSAPAAAKRELAAGQVDSRLLITLAFLAAKLGVRIRSFGDAAPGAGAGVPLRLVILSAPAHSSYVQRLLALLHAQRSPLQAIVSPQRHGQTSSVQIEFTAPSPIGLLTAGAQQ